MKDLMLMQFDTNPIRVVDMNGEPWFVGKDVAEALGYADTTNAVKQHCRGVVKHHPIADALGRTQQARVLAEGDVLRLVINSKLPAAERFERWVFDEVLPTIRRTGVYAAPKRKTPELTVIAVDFRAASSIARTAGLKDNHARISAARMVENIHGVDPLKLAGVTHQVAQDQVRHLTPTELGKCLGESARAFNKRLAAKGLQIRDATSWVPTDAGRPYAVLLDTEKRHKSGAPVLQLKWLESVLAVVQNPIAA